MKISHHIPNTALRGGVFLYQEVVRILFHNFSTTEKRKSKTKKRKLNTLFPIFVNNSCMVHKSWKKLLIKSTFVNKNAPTGVVFLELVDLPVNKLFIPC